MASKGPKSGKPAPAAATPKPRAVKASPKPEAPTAVVAPEVEEIKPAPVAPVAAMPAPAPAEPEPAPAAAPVVNAVIEAAEEKVEAVAAPQADVAVETVAPEPVAPVAAEAPKPVQKEFRMTTVDPKALFTDFNERAKAAVEKSTKAVEELNEFAKGNVEALVESGKITAKGLEALSQDAAEYSRKSFESATAALKNLAAAKSPTDFFKLQSDFFRGAFDSYVAEASKTTEAMIKLAGEAAQPISSRVAIAAEKAKIAA